LQDRTCRCHEWRKECEGSRRSGRRAASDRRASTGDVRGQAAKPALIAAYAIAAGKYAIDKRKITNRAVACRMRVRRRKGAGRGAAPCCARPCPAVAMAAAGRGLRKRRPEGDWHDAHHHARTWHCGRRLPACVVPLPRTGTAGSVVRPRQHRRDGNAARRTALAKRYARLTPPNHAHNPI